MSCDSADGTFFFFLRNGSGLNFYNQKKLPVQYVDERNFIEQKQKQTETTLTFSHISLKHYFKA